MGANQAIQRVNKVTADLKAATNDSDIVQHLNDIHLVCQDNPNRRQVVGDELANNGLITHLGQMLRVWQTTALLIKTEDNFNKAVDSYSILCNYSDASTKFSKAIADAGINQLFSENLQNRQLIDNMEPESIEFVIIKLSIMTIHNMTRRRNHVYYTVSEADKKTFVEVAASNTHEDEDAKLVCIILLSNTLNEAEMARMGSMAIECIDFLLLNLKTAMRSESRHETGFSIDELLDAVSAFGRFVNQRKTLVDRGILDLFKEICESSDATPVEVMSVLEAMKIFFRDMAIRDRMRNSFDAVRILKRLLRHESSSVRVLSHELLGVLGVTVEIPGSLPDRTDVTQRTNSSLEQQTSGTSTWPEWSSAEVISWLKQRGVSDTSLSKSEIGQLDGALLEELVRMNRSSPDFFYDFIKNQLRISSTDLLKFSAAIRQLSPSDT